MVGVVLCICAGMVNVICFRQMGAFVSHVTGTVSRIGMGAFLVLDGGVASHFLFPLGAVASFVFGAMLCGLAAGRNDMNQVHIGNKLYGFAMLGNAAFLILSMLLSINRGDSQAMVVAAIYIAAVACGLQNGMC